MSDERKQWAITPRVVLGICLILLGVLFTLENLGFGDIWSYWPVLLIAVGASKLLWPASGSSRSTGFVLLAIGLIFLLDENHLGILDFEFWDLFPLVFVLIGISIVWRGLLGRKAEALPEDQATINAVAVLGGSRRTTTSEDFRGGDLVAFMGGVELDLRGAKIGPEPAVIDAFAFWGGVDIKVPPDWTITMRGVPLLGGYEDSTEPPEEPQGRLIVKGFAIMGGVEVKN